MNGYSRGALRHFLSHALISPTQDSILKIKPGTRLQRGYDRAIKVGALGPDIRHKRNIITVRKGKKHVFATSDNFMALDICIYVYVHGLCFQYTFQPKQIHSRVQVQTSKCLVQFLYMCMGGFFPVILLCFVLQRWKLFASEVRSS